jgi:hypothetical protein
MVEVARLAASADGSPPAVVSTSNRIDATETLVERRLAGF